MEVKHKISNFITLDDLRELIHYCDKTGIFTWRNRSEKWFSDNTKNNSTAMMISWNKRHANNIAGSLHSSGYLIIMLLGKRWFSHRLAYYYITGEEPNFVDHIDGIITNNKWDNLRNVTGSTNRRNSKIPSTNSSGVIGVYFYKGKWCPKIGVDGKLISLGRFSDKDEAIRVRKDAEIIYGFHENHGRQ